MKQKRTLLQIEIVPHEDQRYATTGDWQFEDGVLKVKVSDMGDDDHAFMVGVHEAVEAWLCRERGIAEKDITWFDERFEMAREKGNVDEPGDDPEAPYEREHNFATGIERLICSELEIPWKDYEEANNKLYE